MDYIYIAMALIATLAMAGGVVGYLSLIMPIRVYWLEQYMTTLLALSIICSISLINISPY
jgi:hypothetical protein